MGKGSNFEREVCRKLSLWWTNGKDDDVFWRSSQSGGRATTRSKKGKRTRGQEGDIAATDPSGIPLTKLFTMELKRGYNSCDPVHLLDQSDHMAQQGFEKFLVQADNARARGNTPYWMIIHKRDHRQPMVYFPQQFTVDYGIHDFYKPHLLVRCRTRDKSLYRFYGMTLKLFLEIFQPKKIRDLRKKWKLHYGKK